MNNYYLQSILSMLISLILCTSCCKASDREVPQSIFVSQKENGYGKVLTDSVVNILLKSNRIQCELQSKNPIDTARTDTSRILPSDMRSVLRYLILQESNFNSNDTVYGHFETWVSYKFQMNKKKIVYLQLDFGLHKWRMLNANKAIITEQDMKENNLQFVHFTRLLYPEDKTLKLLNDNLRFKK